MISDGRGRGVRGPVTEAAKSSITIRVEQTMIIEEPTLQIGVAQALAKGDRSDLACEMITELGATMIIPWQASRSIVRWQGDRAVKSHAKWVNTVREATKQSRRLRVPEVVAVHSTKQLVTAMADHDLVLVLHEDAKINFSDVSVPDQGKIMIIVGPEGGIAPEELETFTAAGARSVRISDGVLRTSTAAAAAIAAILLR